MSTDLADESVYAIEATCHAPVLEDIYREVYKCLKPGGVFGFYEWNMTDKWDASIPWHKEVAHGVEVSPLKTYTWSIAHRADWLRYRFFATHRRGPSGSQECWLRDLGRRRLG